MLRNVTGEIEYSDNGNHLLSAALETKAKHITISQRSVIVLLLESFPCEVHHLILTRSQVRPPVDPRLLCLWFRTPAHMSAEFAGPHRWRRCVNTIFVCVCVFAHFSQTTPLLD